MARRRHRHLHEAGISEDIYEEETLYSSIDRQEAPIFRKTHVGAVNALAIDNVHHQFLLSAGADSSIQIWDCESVVEQAGSLSQIENAGTIPRKSGHKFGVSSIVWWPFDNGLFATSSFDGEVKIWDTNELSEAYSFNMDTRVYSIDVSKVGDHTLLATASDHPLIRLLDLRTTSSTHTLSGHNGKVLSCKWSPVDSNILMTGGSDGRVKIWDIRRSNACVCDFDMQQVEETMSSTPRDLRRAHRSGVNAVLWYPTGDYVITAGNDEKIRLWSLYPEGGQNLLVNFGPLIRNRHTQTLFPCLTDSKRLKYPYLLFPSDNGEILMLRAADGKLIKRLNRPPQSSLPRMTCIIPRGNHKPEYYSGSLDGVISCWKPQKELNLLPEEAETETVADAWSALQ